jgi:hypothetical protein
MDMQHGHGLAAWAWKQHGHGHTAWTWTCSMGTEMQHELGMQHEHENAAWTSTCCMSKFMSMLHVHVNPAWMSMPHGCMPILHVHTAFPCLCYMSMSMVHVQVRAANQCQRCCPRPCCKSITIFQAHDRDYVHVRYACSCPCSRDIDMQHRIWHSAWAWTRSMCWDMQHGHERAAWTWICNMDIMDIDMQHGMNRDKQYAHTCP